MNSVYDRYDLHEGGSAPHYTLCGGCIEYIDPALTPCVIGEAQPIRRSWMCDACGNVIRDGELVGVGGIEAAPAEVWCARCDQPSTETRGDQALCHACALTVDWKNNSPSWRGGLAAPKEVQS